MMKRAATVQQVSTTIQAKDESYNEGFQIFLDAEEFDTNLSNDGS
jgi:hypothetical protein